MAASTGARVDELEIRVDRIDRIVSSQTLVELSQRLDAMQAELRAQQGRIEELQNENELLKRQQRDLYADLDKRLQGVHEAGNSPARAAAAATTEAESTPASNAKPVAGEQAMYTRAFEALKAKDYAAATEGFRSLAATYPNGELADNTQYWLGETYYVTQEYDHAAAAFQRVLSGWPSSRKVPDAMLKLGYTQIEQNKVAAGRTTLQQLVDRYPDSDAAKLAADRLAQAARPVAEVAWAGIHGRIRLTENHRDLPLAAGRGDAVGFPTVFVRLTGCPLRCQYCDTGYAFTGGKRMLLDDILGAVASFNTKHVCVTGGEPLAQKNCLRCSPGFAMPATTCRWRPAAQCPCPAWIRGW